ncbi:MAG TPA: hypothetical protein VKR56_08100 [Candidatus Cybelea sp.]|nr:hypothetical protein [Candidatus Cybelea sp.]
MIRKILVTATFAGLAMALGSAAIGEPTAAAQAAPSGEMTLRFTTFLSDVLAGRVPPDISETLRSQSSTMLTQVRGDLGKLGEFRRLTYVRQDSSQGYLQYHYVAVFDKASQPVVFVTNSSGIIYGFFQDQPVPKEGGPPSASLTETFSRFFTDVLAGRVPSANMSAAMRTGLTPSMISRIRSSFSSLGAFVQLRFVKHNTTQGYQGYHYSAVFQNGSQPILFVTDSNGTIVGFFQDQQQ